MPPGTNLARCVAITRIECCSVPKQAHPAPIGSIRASLLWYRGRRPVGLRRDTRNRRVRRCGPSRGFQCVILRDPAPIGSAPASGPRRGTGSRAPIGSAPASAVPYYMVSRETTSWAPAGHGKSPHAQLLTSFRVPEGKYWISAGPMEVRIELQKS